MKLYIIGNGFDLAHNLKTSYANYREYILNNLNTNDKWNIILEFYPDNYEFWSDIEYNVCNINYKLYLKLKNTFGFGLLDELHRRIHKSFDNFILHVESDVLTKKPIFIFEDNSLFLTFNYTTLLEDVYKIQKDKIVYVHNDISGPAFEILYNLENKAPCIIGHSPIYGDYAIPKNKDLLRDKEYLEYIKATTKKSDEIILNKDIAGFLLKSKNKIDEIVYYGFSFSIADKAYIKTIDMILPDKPIKIFYKLKDGESEEQCISSLKKKVSLTGINLSRAFFVNCDDTKVL